MTRFYISCTHSSGNFNHFHTLAQANRYAKRMVKDGYENVTITRFDQGGDMQIIKVLNK